MKIKNIVITQYIKTILQNIIERDFKIKVTRIILQTKEGKYQGPHIRIYYEAPNRDYTTDHYIFLSDYKFQRDEPNLQQILCFCEDTKDIMKISNKTYFDILLLIKEINDFNLTIKN